MRKIPDCHLYTNSMLDKLEFLFVDKVQDKLYNQPGE